MIAACERALERLLRLPPEPHAPPGASRGVDVLQPARGELRYRLTRWSVRRAFALAGLLVALAISHSLDQFLSFEGPEIRELLARLPADLVRWMDRVQVAEPHAASISLAGPLVFLELLGIALFVAQIPFGLAAVRLEWARRRYLLTDRSLRLRQGIVRADEMTLTLANVQQVSVTQGPLQRLFGIADVEVRTAGGGGRREQGSSGGSGEDDADDAHAGTLRGLADAEAVRRAILARAQRGGGDAPAEAAEAAAERLLAEARGLRRDLEARAGTGTGRPGSAQHREPAQERATDRRDRERGPGGGEGRT